MRIVQVELENFKSYAQASVPFTPGTNAICGRNGAGKSTLLEAIGFAVFGHAPYTQSRLVREGENTATVTVHLQDDDGRVYQVVRKCGGYSQHYIYDPELDQKLVEGVGDSLAWLRDFLEVEETGDLSALFQDAVGVPQGLLTAVFLESPSRRKDTFNPLLRVDEYESVWRRLLEPQRRIENQITEQEKQIAGFEAEVKMLPEWEDKAARLQEEIEGDERAEANAQTELKNATERKEHLEAIKERLDELERSVTQAEADAKALQAQMEEAQKAVERAEEAQSVVAETEPGHQAYTAAQKAMAGLEEQRRERKHLKERLQEHTTGLALAKQEVERLKTDLKKIAEAEGKMEALQPQVEVQEWLEAELTKAKRAADRLADAEARLARAKAHLADLKAKLAEIESGLEERAEAEKEIAALKAELETLDDQRDDLTPQISAHEAELGHIREQTATLEATEAAACPVCEGPLTPEHREELLARNGARQEEIERTLEVLKSQQEEMEEARNQKRENLQTLEERIKELPRPAEAEDLLVQIGEQQRDVDEIEVIVTKSADAPAEVERLTADLEELGDPRRAYQRASDTADRRERAEKDLAAAEAQVIDLSGQIGALEEGLAAYEDLDEQLETQRAALDEHEPDHQRYLEHIREAEALVKRRGKVESLTEALEAAQEDVQGQIEERARVAEGYDAEAYTALTKDYERLREEIATLEERLRQRRERLEEAQTKIERLTEAQEQLTETIAERDALQETVNLLTYFRQLLRDAGPEVTRRLVDVISIEADRLYADIMQDYGTRLRWTEDYDIVLSKDGRERTFPQLSGGEEMAAALAVRLALLREVTGIDVAFFDEPTANLDDQRRDNLAEQILNVKGFSQLFVISHDDTFEQDTDHVVRVVKEDGVSRVNSEATERVEV